MRYSSVLIPLCASFFAAAILAGYVLPRLEKPAAPVDPVAVALAPAPPVPRPAIPQMTSPLAGKIDPNATTPIGAKSPLEGPARDFLQRRSAYIYYDPPQGVNDFTFQGLDRQYQKRDDLKGGYTLLNIWATWCGYCLAEMPSLQRAKDRFQGTNMNILSISIDNARNIDFIESFLRQRGFGDVGMNYDHEGTVPYAFPVAALPVTFLLNPKGEVLYSIGGMAEWDSPDALAFLESFVPLNQ